MSYGHAYVEYGWLNEIGAIGQSRIVGRAPAGESEACEYCGALPWLVGHVIPVPARTEAGRSDRVRDAEIGHAGLRHDAAIGEIDVER